MLLTVTSDHTNSVVNQKHSHLNAFSRWKDRAGVVGDAGGMRCRPSRLYALDRQHRFADLVS